MQRFLSGVLVAVVVSSLAGVARADDQEVKAILDKAIKALGGEARLGSADAFSSKSKGTFTFNGNESQFTSVTTVQGLDHFRSEFEGEFGGNKVMGVTVLSGDKGWRKFGDNSMDLDASGVANEKRTVYLQVIPVTLMALKSKDFKVETAGEEQVVGKPAAVLKVTAPDGKDFTLSFDKTSGFPVKLVAKVVGFQGMEFTQESTYSDFSDYNGIKRAKRVESKRDGEIFATLEVIEFKVIDKVDPKLFTQPE